MVSAVIAAAAVAYLFLTTEFYFLPKYFGYFIAAAAFMAGYGLAAYVVIRNRFLPRSYNVAILGFPKSGKTTLIVSLFGEIFARRITSVKAILRGAETIQRVNDCLQMIERGKALGPTRSQDRFGFRVDMTQRKILARTYKVEFGDFPGDSSKEYIEKYGPWLHTTEFFKWVAESDSMVFVVDLGLYLLKRTQYVPQISSAIRAAWQNYVDTKRQLGQEAGYSPLALVFSKADLFGFRNLKGVRPLQSVIMRFGFGEEVPPVKDIDHKAYAEGSERVRRDFRDLISYLESESRSFKIIFTSCFGLLEGKRLGIEELLDAILPR